MYRVTRTGMDVFDDWGKLEAEVSRKFSEVHIRVLDACLEEGAETIDKIVSVVRSADHLTFLDEKYVVRALADLMMEGCVVGS
jgi:hypothetical protein